LAQAGGEEIRMTTAITTSGRRGDELAPEEACPACGVGGRKVMRVTLESLLRPERRGDIDGDQYYVCATPSCDTVYFGAHRSRTFRRSDLTVRFGLKETDAPRHVCYCFDHTVEEIQEEIRRTATCTVVERIKAEMKGPGCRCTYTNPLGCCCLKTVQDAVATVLRSVGHEEQVAAAGAVDRDDCCARKGHTSDDDVGAAHSCTARGEALRGGSDRNRAGALAAGGSVAAAMLSSACCWLPLVLIVFGASAARGLPAHRRITGLRRSTK
jgi:Zinc binding domain